jgi:hypothetical protein
LAPLFDNPNCVPSTSRTNGMPVHRHESLRPPPSLHRGSSFSYPRANSSERSDVRAREWGACRCTITTRVPPRLSQLRGFSAICLMLLRLVNRNLFLGPLFDTYKPPGEWSDLDGVFGGVFQTIRRVDVDLGRRDILMPECVAYLFYRGTVLKGHCGKGMPQ